MSSTSALFGAANPFSNVIDQLIQLESEPKQRLESQVESQQNRLSAVDKVGSNLSSFNNLLTSFLDPGNEQINIFEATSSNPDAFTATANQDVQGSSTFDFSVNQLAKNDIKVSGQFTATDTISNLASDGKSFRIKIGGEIVDINQDGTGDTSDTISVNANNGDTFESVLNEVAGAINNSVASDDVTASVVRENTDTVRLSVRSRQTGEEQLIEFENDVPTNATEENIAEILQFTQGGTGNPNRGEDISTVISEGSEDGGRIFAPSELNAEFQIDGLNFERSSNSVDDAIEGVTIDLQQVTSSPETITTSADTEGARENIQEFIDQFNSIVTDIRNKSFLNADTGERGPLANDRLFKDLTFTLRNTIINDVTAASDSSLNSIFEIGLNVTQQGTLEIEDETKLDDALSNNADAVKEIFTATDGLANNLQNVIESFIKGENSILDSFRNSVNSEIDLLNDRIQSENQFLERRREQLEEQFQQLQQVQIEAQNQQQALNAFGTGAGSGSSLNQLLLGGGF